jgi:hypothetical protein
MKTKAMCRQQHNILKCFMYILVYMLWQYPNVLPSFATWAPVIQKIAGGAGKSFNCNDFQKE